MSDYERRSVRHAQDDALCSLSFDSMTAAMQAQNILAEKGVRTSLKKITDTTGKKGCTWDLRLPCKEQADAALLLNRSGLLKMNRGQKGGNHDLSG